MATDKLDTRTQLQPPGRPRFVFSEIMGTCTFTKIRRNENQPHRSHPNAAVSQACGWRTHRSRAGWACEPMSGVFPPSCAPPWRCSRSAPPPTRPSAAPPTSPPPSAPPESPPSSPRSPAALRAISALTRHSATHGHRARTMSAIHMQGWHPQGWCQRGRAGPRSPARLLAS